MTPAAIAVRIRRLILEQTDREFLCIPDILTVAEAAHDGIRFALDDDVEKSFPTIVDADNGTKAQVAATKEAAYRLQANDPYRYVTDRSFPVIAGIPVTKVRVEPENDEDRARRRLKELLEANEKLKPAVDAMLQANHTPRTIIETLF